MKGMLTDEIDIARKEAWSIENMEAHGAYGRKCQEIGREEINEIIFIYYKDNMGEYWYRSKRKYNKKKCSIIYTPGGRK